MYKKFLSTFVTLLFTFQILIIPFAYANELIIHDKVTEEILAKGVTRKHIERFTTDGWLNINIIEADLRNNYLDVKLLTDNRGVSYLNNVLNLAQENDIVAAINADFFQRVTSTTDRGSAIGPMVEDGKLISSQAHQAGMAAFWTDHMKRAFMDYWSSEIILTAPNGNTAKIKHINKHDPLDSIVIYTRDWGTYSQGSYNNIVEVVVENDIVREIRREMEPIEIPENGYIITNLPEFDAFLIDNFEVGDPVELSIVTTPDFNNIDMAIGGGTILVKDGQPAPITHNISGRHPRSAIGTDAEGKIIYMVTVDGRQEKSKGMTLEEFTHLLINLGVKNAINLDGGGSTTLVTRSLGETNAKVVNATSENWLRNVTNAVGISSNAPKTNKIGKLLINSDDKNIFVNTSRTFELKAYDSNYNPMEIDQNSVKWTNSGVEGSFKGNTFYPYSTGWGTIQATYEGITATYEIHVLDQPAELILSTNYLNTVSGDAAPLTLTGKNMSGYSAKISLLDAKWNIPNQIVEIFYDRIKGLKKGSGICTITVGSVNTHLAITVDGTGIIDDFEKLNGTFSSYPNYIEGSYMLSEEQKRSGNYSGKLSFDFTSEQAESKAAYFAFNTGISIPQNIHKIGLWVYGSSDIQHWLRGEIRGADQQVHRIDFARRIDWNGWKYVEAPIPDNIPSPMELKRLYIVQIDSQIKNSGSIYFDDLIFVRDETNVQVVELPQDITLPDALNTYSELQPGENNFRLAIFGKPLERRTLLSGLINNKVMNTLNKTAQLAVFVGNDIDIETLDKLSIEKAITLGYSAFDYKDAAIVRLDNSNGGFRSTDPYQWIWFKERLEIMQNKNIFIFLPKPLTGPNGMSDAAEVKLFKQLLEEHLVKSGKNVFVFYNDAEAKCTVEQGIRYISTPGMNSVNKHTVINDIKNYKYILLTINGEHITYEIKNIVE
jgi:hypothetical protein